MHVSKHYIAILYKEAQNPINKPCISGLSDFEEGVKFSSEKLAVVVKRYNFCLPNRRRQFDSGRPQLVLLYFLINIFKNILVFLGLT